MYVGDKGKSNIISIEIEDGENVMRYHAISQLGQDLIRPVLKTASRYPRWSDGGSGTPVYEGRRIMVRIQRNPEPITQNKQYMLF